MLQKFESDCSDFRFGSDFIEADSQRLQLLSWNLRDVRTRRKGIGKLFLDGIQILEEGSVILDLLVEDGRGLLVQLGRHVVGVDQSFTLIQPFTNLAEFSGKCCVKLPAPVADLFNTF